MAKVPNVLRAREGGSSLSAQRLADFPLHPFLFALASVMALIAGDLAEASLADAAPALGSVIVFAGAVYLLAALVRRRFDAAAAVIASIWVVGCLHYARLFEPLNRMLDGDFPMVKSLPFALLALVLLTAAGALVGRWLRPVHIVLNVVALVMFATPIWKAVAHEWDNGAAREVYDPDHAAAQMPQIAKKTTLEQSGTTRPPDIYHFVFDRYAREDVLRRHFDLDNSAIGRLLEDRGFYVARASNSNYLKTGHSLASTFYMDYLDFLGADPRVEGGNWHPIYEMLDDHRVARFLKARGFDFIQFGSWWRGTYRNPVADENHPHGFSEFDMMYLRGTILRPLFGALPDTDLTMRLDWDNGQCQRVADQIRELKAIGERDRPVYVFAHFLIPHGPYVFAADGTCITQQASARRGKKQGYIEHVAYANKIIEEVVTSLQSHKYPPLILIQADEGPYPGHDYRVSWENAPAEALRIKTGILNAYYFAGGDYSLLYPDITPVNSYRVLFNTVFGTDFSLLPDRIFAFPSDAAHYEFHDVTDKVRSGPAPDPDGLSQHAPSSVAN